MSNVKIVKLAGSLQEVIAKVLSEDATSVLLESPLVLQPLRTNDGIGLGLLPFSLGGVASQVTFPKTQILCLIDAEEQIQSQYLASLAGLTIANPKSIVL